VCRQRSPSPPPRNNASTKEMFVSTFCTMFAEEIGSVSTSMGTSSSRKSTKMLNSVNQYSLHAYAGQKITEEVPDIFVVLDINKHITTKVQALEDRLNEAQSANTMVRITLHRELVKEFMQHAFFLAPLEGNMMHGFTPFCIQSMKKNLSL